ncbi:TPA: hypothetical protein ACHJUL_004720 [Escherichia coli]|uniref:hypothetical protein n=1 Tax=Escherichia coli TaxID=562 RepID=UPI000945DCA9|nr:hypothetical protein [Escherichia coli]EFD0040473.1 hypothetical protein [Escherichia coli]EFJ5561993.1 hypothetical protein [Escherichia coli]EFJ5688128.1 hypothetical protein [Escherichia coli]EFJ5692869.1 hypothetical protein [Escherichia coli]EFK3243787.1 hypothetical protein [Escherichia coli]
MQTSMQIKKLTRIHQETIVDEDGIQKLHTSRESFTIPAEPPYVKLYLADIGAIHGLSKSQSDVLFQLAMLIGWDGIVSVSKTRFEKTIKPRVGIEYQSFKNIVAKLVEKGIFLRSGRGELEANPFIFARGDWPSIYERRKSIELTITYDVQGRSFKSKLLNK